MDEIAITLRITQNKKIKIDQYCKKHGLKKSDFYRDLIDLFIDIQEEQEKQTKQKITEVFYDKH